MSQHFQRFTALAAAIVLVLSLSVSAENRSRGRTDLEKLAADLERALGPGSVSVEGNRPPRQPVASSTDRYADAIVAAMNRERIARGLGELRLNSRLSLAAEDRVEDMLAKRYFAHVSPDGVDPFTWVVRRGYRYSLVGENLALGYRGSQSVVTGWMNSPGHRANILKRGFDEVGIAFVDASPQRGYRGPLVVALYGTR
jgi:uncharacterized protein YkwD